MTAITSTNIFAAFAGHNLITRGVLSDVALRCKQRLASGESARISVFDDDSGHIVDIDLSGSEAAVLARVQADAPGQKRGPGRPKLGVVCREVSLLPRHWDWLSEQRGGASATLRRLVEVAKKSESHEAIARRAVDAAHRFMWDIAGEQPDFEEATRCLFAMDFDRFLQRIADWPAAIREQLTRYVDRARESH